jgi:hypothetical protein
VSIYTQSTTHPKLTAAVLVGLLVAAGFWLTSRPRGAWR